MENTPSKENFTYGNYTYVEYTEQRKFYLWKTFWLSFEFAIQSFSRCVLATELKVA